MIRNILSKIFCFFEKKKVSCWTRVKFVDKNSFYNDVVFIYDVPSHFRILENRNYRIVEFKYIDGKEKTWKRKIDEFICVKEGIWTNRIFEIKINKKCIEFESVEKIFSPENSLSNDLNKKAIKISVLDIINTKGNLI